MVFSVSNLVGFLYPIALLRCLLVLVDKFLLEARGSCHCLVGSLPAVTYQGTMRSHLTPYLGLE
jgi:hypothetical protein